MRIRFWGTRGSIPSPGAATVRYGGNTPCVEVRSDTGALAILDAGTGIRALGEHLLAAGASLSADVYVTHAHWDHIQGLPFFAPLYASGHHLRIWGADHVGDRVQRAVRAQMAPDVFPVPFEEVRAAVSFRSVGADATESGDLAVDAHPLRHPGGALGYRLSECNDRSRAVVYIPDNELDERAAYDAPADWRARLLSFISGSALLVHDAMYTSDEGAAFRGWGHSTVEETVRLAVDAAVPRLALFHHRPERHDDAVDALLDGARRHARTLGGTVEILAAAEGQCLTL